MHPHARSDVDGIPYQADIRLAIPDGEEGSPCEGLESRVAGETRERDELEEQ
jgi:hypothetical protein